MGGSVNGNGSRIVKYAIKKKRKKKEKNKNSIRSVK